MIARVPLNRPGETEEVAAAALNFASHESRFTTGTEIRIDCGIAHSLHGQRLDRGCVCST